MQFRFVPTAGVVNYELNYPVGIAVPDDKTYIIRSSNFLLNGQICYLQNKLNSNNIEVVEISSGTVVVDNIGNYDETTGGNVFLTSQKYHTHDDMMGLIDYLK